MLLPRQCQHCGKLVHHYGACVCPDEQLKLIDAKRAELKRQLKKLDAEERDILGLVPLSEDA